MVSRAKVAREVEAFRGISAVAMTFRVELVWQGEEGGTGQAVASSIYLTKDGRVVLQGKHVTPQERAELDLPQEAALVSVDRALIQAIKEML